MFLITEMRIHVGPFASTKKHSCCMTTAAAWKCLWTIRPAQMQHACRLDKKMTTRCHTHRSMCEGWCHLRMHLHPADACLCRKARCPLHIAACGCNPSHPSFPS